MTDALATRTTMAMSPLDTLLSNPEKLAELPIDTVERLSALDQKYRAEFARRAFADAFNRVQKEMMPVKARGQNESTRSTFARAEDVTGMLDPILVDNGFSRSISTEDCPVEGHLRFVLVLRHTGGHEERHRLDAPIDDVGMRGSPTKTKLHGMASSYTYCERHLLCKVFGVQTFKDDDGNAGATGPGARPITEDQAIVLSDLVKEVGADWARFLRFFKVTALDDLPASRYNEATRMLSAKKR